MLKIILPASLLGLVALGGGGLYLLSQKLELGKPASESRSLLSINSTDKDTDAGAVALRMTAESLLGGPVVKADIDLRGLLPAAPDGWFAKGYDVSDGEEITDTTMIRTAISKSTTNDILLRFSRDSGVGKRAEVGTYIRGSMKMALRMRANDQINENTVQGVLMAQAAQNMSAVMAGMPGAVEELPFATVDGVPLILKPRHSRKTVGGTITPVDYRRFELQLGGAITLELITNARDIDVVALMGMVDMAALQAIFPRPTPDYVPGDGVTTARAEGFSSELPGPTPMMRAIALIETGAVGQDQEGRFIREIAEGDITSWRSLESGFRRSDQLVTARIIDLLGPMPVDMQVMREAAFLRDEMRSEFSAEDLRLLSELSRGNLRTQQVVGASQVWLANHDARVAALVHRLPLGALAENLPNLPGGPARIDPSQAAMVAQSILNAGVDLKERETEILQAIVDGRVASWDDVATEFEVYGYAPWDSLIRILGPEPRAQEARRRAGTLIANGSEAGVFFAQLLHAIQLGEITTQEQVAAHRQWDVTYIADEVLEIARLLPGDAVADVTVQAEVATDEEGKRVRPSVRRGADGSALGDGACTMELGVRRCILDN